MKKIILPLCMLLLASMISFTATAQTEATTYFEEVFDYVAGSELVADAVASAGNLDEITAWYTRSNSLASTNTYTVSPSPLFYDGYALSGVGKGVTFSGEKGQTVGKAFTSTIKVEDETTYISFLINIPAGSTSTGDDYFFGIHNQTSVSNSNTSARTYVKVENDEITFGVNKYNGNPVWAETTYPTGETLLVVYKYYNGLYANSSSGTYDDEVRIYINPDMTSEPSDDDAIVTHIDATVYDAYRSSSTSLAAICLRSCYSSSDEIPPYQISGMRVTDSYEALFADYTGDASVTDPDDTETDEEVTTPDVDDTTDLGTLPTGEYSLTPTDDTYYYKSGSSYNYGSEETLLVYHTSSANYRAVTYLKFDISEVEEINDVTISLYFDGVDATGHSDNHVLNMIPIEGDYGWTEDNLTYDDFSTLVGSTLTDVLVSYPIAEVGEVCEAQYINFASDELTQLFQDSLAVGAQSVTVLIREAVTVTDASGKVFLSFHSKENASGKAPQLVINAITDGGDTTPDVDEDTSAPVVDGLTTTLTVTDDTYIRTDEEVYGAEDELLSYYTSSKESYCRQPYVKFDISSITTTSLTSVTLKLYAEIAEDHVSDHIFQIHPVLIDDWSEDVLSYSNYTTYAGERQTTVLSSYTVPAEEGLDAQYIDFSGDALKAEVAAAISAGDTYVSFRLCESEQVKTSGGSSVYVSFHSKENTSGNAPKLVIVADDVSAIAANDAAVAKFAVANGTLYVSQEDNTAAYQIYNTAGTLLQTGSLDAGVSSISMPYANGLYIVKLVSNQTTYVEKVIVK